LLTVPSVARTVAEPTLSARTSTAVPDVVDRLPIVASLVHHVTATFGRVVPFASCTVAVKRADWLSGAVPDDGVITMPAAATETGVVTVCVPLAAVSVVVIVALPTPTPRTNPAAL